MSASELAQMGTCERLVLLEHRLGKRRTAEQEAAIHRGLARHARFYEESRRLISSEPEHKAGRCFVATLLLAESSQSPALLAALQAYRDKALKTTALGRYLVLSYYRAGPTLCRILTRHAWLERPARTIVICIAGLAARWMKHQ